MKNKMTKVLEKVNVVKKKSLDVSPDFTETWDQSKSRSKHAKKVTQVLDDVDIEVNSRASRHSTHSPNKRKRSKKHVKQNTLSTNRNLDDTDNDPG